MHDMRVHRLISHHAPSSSDRNLIPLYKTGFGGTIYLHPPPVQDSLSMTCVDVLSLCGLRSSRSEQLEMSPRAEQATVGSESRRGIK